MRPAPHRSSRRCLHKAGAVLLIGLAQWLVCTRAFGATTILEPSQVAREFTQRVWTKEQGLPDNRVQAIQQTHDGYLWIATQRGLARFDGLRFTVFDHLNTPQMKNDDCRLLAEDSDGNLWVNTTSGLLWNKGNGFQRFTLADGVIGRPFYSLCPSRSGGLWIGGHIRVAKVRVQSNTAQVYEKGLPGGPMGALAEDAAGDLFVGTLSGLFRFDARKGSFEPADSGMDFTRQPVTGLRRGLQDELWILFAKLRPDGKWSGDNAWLTCLKDGRWLRTPQSNQPDFIFAVRSTFLASDESGSLWLPSNGGGLNRFSGGEFSFYPFSNPLEKDWALCVLEDREGNLWSGTESSGLCRWTPRKVVTHSVRDGLADDNTWTICEARDGSVWIGTEQGLSQFKQGRFRNFTKLDGLPGDKIRSVAEDAAGDLWVGTGSGLAVIHEGAVRQQSFPHNKPERNKIRVVYPTRNGALWLGTVDGLFRLQDGAWETFRPADGLANADVRALREDKAGNLWIGTAGGGLQRFGLPPSGGLANHTGNDSEDAPSRLKPGLQTFTTFTTTNGLSNNSVWALHEDADGVLWIGTESGLNRYERGRFSAFTTREGLPADLVNEILEDEFGHLWVSHDHGIYRVRKQELNEVAAGRAKSVHAVSYEEADGLPSIETNGQKSQPAGCKTRDGRLWFPTTKGVAVIDPKLSDRDAVAPLAAIEQVRADGEIIFDSAGLEAPSLESRLEAASSGNRLKAELRTGTPLRLPPGTARVLEFRYTANIFTAPEKSRFRYRMIGVDDHWVDAGTRREAYFANLRPGAYAFELIACNHHGVWGETSANFSFYIQPFYYQTWWFYLVCGLATTGLLAGLVLWRMRKLRKLHRSEQQSAITDERTRIAKDLHDGLGADLTRLALLADLADEAGSATAAGHRQKLSQSSREAARTLKEMIWIANPANDTVEGLVSRICQTAEDFLGDARIRCRLELAPQLPQRSLSLDQRRNLLLVAREALNNIVKHAAATEVCIRANGSDDNFQLGIEDNGRGFDSSSVRPDGLGLASMRRRVENLGGAFVMETRPGSGTKILINIKLSE